MEIQRYRTALVSKRRRRDGQLQLGVSNTQKAPRDNIYILKQGAHILQTY